MLIEALKECPQGQLPGTIWEAPDGAAEVLIAVGAARKVEDDKRPSRRRYQTRDMRAEA